ncbi:MAG TPA: ammonium transporter [bacterium]|nr:ammonium transporter [bacterium]
MKFLQDLFGSLKKKPVLLALVGFSFLVAVSAMAQTAAPAAAPAATPAPAAPAAPAISAGDTAWLLASSALVLLMTPGLAFFYAGMVRRKNVMATIMQSFFMICLISVQWVVFGYSWAFGDGNAWMGGMKWFMLDGMPDVSPLAPTVPHYAYMIFQAMFAIITPALICGAYAERVSFKGFVLFSLLWATFVYDPVCHWVWSPNGYFCALGALDFAGGTVVHMTAGYSALALALLLGTRKGYGKENMAPHNLTLVLLGASLLWFGWFGFNAGSACAANALSCNAFVTTNTATAMAAISWCVIELLHRGKATTLGAASGAVAGLVAITPACGFVNLSGSIWIGALVSVFCYLAIQVKLKMGYDDSLDAFGVHGVGGTFGAIATGLWAVKSVNGHDGLFAGNPAQLMIQVKTVLATMIFSFVMTVVLYFLVEKTIGLRVNQKDEELGLDLSQHGEEGYMI